MSLSWKTESRSLSGAGAERKSLARQLTGLLCFLAFGLSLVSLMVQLRIVLPSFQELEQKDGITNMERCLNGLKRDIEQISTQCNEWGAWDDTYRFVAGENKQFRDTNLVAEFFRTSHMNLLAFYNLKRELVWGEARDMHTLQLQEVPDLWQVLADPSNRIIDHRDEDDSHEGIILTSKGPLLLAARPIIRGNREGPIRGSALMGRFLNDAEIAALATRTQSKLKVWTFNDSRLPRGEAEFLASVQDWSRPQIVARDRDTLMAYARFDDLLGKPVLLIRAEMPRLIMAEGRLSAKIAVLASLLGSLVIIGVAGWITKKKVINPLQTLAAHADLVGKEDNLKARLNLRRSDEIGSLARSIDFMISSLEESREKVLDSAHRAGMAEVAREVLHNVGNVVNTANASLEVLRNQYQKSRLGGLEKTMQLLAQQGPRLAEFFAQDPRGPIIMEYLTKVTSALQQENAQARRMVDRLSKSIDHIRSIVSIQQQHARGAQFDQEVRLDEIIREILLLKQEMIDSMAIEVNLRMEDLPILITNKSKLSQVLMNLVKNALEAMRDVPSSQRTLLVRAEPCHEGVLIEIRDTGPGFPDLEPARLFESGFTTKAAGSGIGLHYCANAIRSMGGSIRAKNCSSPNGASFLIWLPTDQNSPRAWREGCAAPDHEQILQENP